MTQRVQQFHNDGLTFDVRDTGPLEGPVVVLLHGFPQRASCWDAVAERLHEQGFRTVAPDQRGYSPGARPTGRRAYRASRLVSDVEALIRTVDAGPVHLVGHDWGAAVAWPTAAQHPDLVRTLTAVSVAHPGAFLRSMLGTQLLRSWYMGFFQLPWVPERVLSSPTSARRALGASGMRREELATFRRDIVEYGALAGGLGWYRGLPFSHPGVAQAKVRVPALQVWSDKDTALGRRSVELNDRFVDAPYSLEVLEGVSHWIPEQEPDRLAALVLGHIA